MANREEPTRDSGVKVLRKAVQILDAFTPDRPSRSLGAIAKAVGLNPATARRILVTLEELDLVNQDAETREYSLGMKVFELGSRLTHQLAISRIAGPVMTALMAECGEAVYLGIYDAGDVIYTDIVESHHPLRIAVRTGERLPSHCTGTGKVLLAHLEAADLLAVLGRQLPRFTDRTLANAEELLPELRAIRHRGYALSCEEHFGGIASVGAPICERTGKVVAALSLCGPSYRLTEEYLHRLAVQVTAAANRITLALGGRPLAQSISNGGIVG